MENETFFSSNRKCDLDMIWHQDKYWKPSTGSTLEDFELGSVIFHDLNDFFSKIWDTCQIFSKTWIWNFFMYNQNFAFRSEISLWQYQKWTKHNQNVFLSCLYRWRFLENFQERVGFRQGQLGFWPHVEWRKNQWEISFTFNKQQHDFIVLRAKCFGKILEKWDYYHEAEILYF